MSFILIISVLCRKHPIIRINFILLDLRELASPNSAIPPSSKVCTSEKRHTTRSYMEMLEDIETSGEFYSDHFGFM